LLLAGIRANDRIGANKSTGMGKYVCAIREVSVNDSKLEVEDLLESLSDLEYYQMVHGDTG